MLLPYLPDPLPRLLLFGGKGGVGKTTMAAATAVCLAKRRPDLRLTLASSDPAHSLGDVLGLRLSGDPVPVPSLPNLRALHLDAAACWHEFKRNRQSGIAELLSDGLELSDREVERALGLPLPGLDEIVALLEIERMAEPAATDVLIIDTAPTGHTVRLLQLPDTLPVWLEILDRTMDKQRYIASRFGPGRETAADRFVQATLDDLERIRGLLGDRTRCRFIPVMLPETVVVEETERLIDQLSKLRIPVTHVIVNRHQGDTSEPEVERFRKRAPGIEFVCYPLLAREVIGVDDLNRFVSGGELSAPVAAVSWKGSGGLRSCVRQIRSSVRVVLVGGKGGVGKSTVAAALGFEIRAQKPADPVLLYSTDPAHSLADVLGVPIGHMPVEVAGYAGLWGQQMDPFRALEELKQVPRQEVAELFERLTDEEEVDLPFEREVLSAILDLVPPGLDEAMALGDLSRHMARKEYRIFVLDTAPTGHLLRLLETPDLALRWLGFVRELLVKRGLRSKLRKTAEMMSRLIVDLERLRGVLRSAETCHTVVVATPEKVVLAETERLATALRALGIPIRTLVLNRVADAGSLKAARAIAPSLFEGTELVTLPRLPIGPRGRDLLVQLS